MATYEALRDRALNKVDCLGQTEAQTVAQYALEEAMRFVSFHVRIPTLLVEVTATQAATTNPSYESNALPLFTTGFNITPSTTFQCVDRLYIKKDSTTVTKGTPYEYMEYHQFCDLKNVSTSERYGIYSPASYDETPNFAYTVTPSNTVWATPVATGNVYTLIYRKAPAAYSGASSPEILPLFDHILVNGAEMVLKEWLREPAEISTTWSLFTSGLMNEVKEYDQFLQGGHRRTHLKIHRSYRPNR